MKIRRVDHYISVGIVVLLLYCCRKPEPAATKNAPADSTLQYPATKSVAEEPAVYQEPKPDAFDLNHSFRHDDIQIGEVDWNVESSQHPEPECKGWTLAAGDLKDIIKLSHVVSGSEIHDLYYTLPCSFETKLVIDGVPFSANINAGSYLYLFNDSTQCYLGCSDDSCRRFFLKTGGNFERDIPKEQ